VAFFVEPVLAAHDRSVVELFCYATCVREGDTTSRMKALSDHWRDCARLTDRAIAEAVRRDEIDILIDLNGHFLGNRLPVFAARAAPVQVTWIGYPNTTGLTAMDFRIVDEITDPPGSEEFHSERLVRLAPGFLCYRPPAEAPPPRYRGEHAPFIFASFNWVMKYSDSCIAIWSSILRRVPNARLRLKDDELSRPETREKILNLFGLHDIDPGRVELLPRMSTRLEHLDAYNDVDVALDPFPYNGTTTTSEALWMGTPVLTLRGKSHVARVGASLLTRVGLPELIAETHEDYIERAVQLAQPGSAATLRRWRETIRPAMAESPLCRADKFVPALEAAFVEMANIRRAEMLAPGSAAAKISAR